MTEPRYLPKRCTACGGRGYTVAPNGEHITCTECVAGIEGYLVYPEVRNGT